MPLLFLPAFFLPSCVNSPEPGTFGEGSLVEIENLRTVIDTVGASRILYCGGNRLLVGGNQTGQVLRTVDLEAANCSRLVFRGRGPIEAIMCWDLFKVSDTEYYLCSGTADSRVLCLSYADGGFEIVDKKQFPPFMRVRSLGDNFLFLPIGRPERFLLTDKSGTEIRSVPFPSVYEEMKNNPLGNLKMQCLLEVSPEKNLIVTAGMSYPYLDIYSSDFELLAHVKGPFEDDARTCFYTLRVGTDGIMAGMTNENGAISALLLYDLEGNPVRRYNLPEPISTFDIDWKGERLFALTKNDSIVCYRMQ